MKFDWAGNKDNTKKENADKLFHKTGTFMRQGNNCSQNINNNMKSNIDHAASKNEILHSQNMIMKPGTIYLQFKNEQDKKDDNLALNNNGPQLKIQANEENKDKKYLVLAHNKSEICNNDIKMGTLGVMP